MNGGVGAVTGEGHDSLCLGSLHTLGGARSGDMTGNGDGVP